MIPLKTVSRLYAVSARTLRYYDQIGLLKPSALTPAGYRLYDAPALERLESILLFRELRFSLKEIKVMLDSPGYDRTQALERQIHLLELERDRLERIIRFAKSLQKGEHMTVKDVFDTKDIKAYREETKRKWGATDAYTEYAARGKAADMAPVFKRFAALNTLAPEAAPVQAQVRALQDFITQNFYTCTDDILSGLGEMYTADARFKAYIDAFGDGTAAFVSRAVNLYCGI